MITGESITEFREAYYGEGNLRWKKGVSYNLLLNTDSPEQWVADVTEHANARGLEPLVIGRIGPVQWFPPDEDIGEPYVCMFTQGEYKGNKRGHCGDYRVILGSDNAKAQKWAEYVSEYNAAAVNAAGTFKRT